MNRNYQFHPFHLVEPSPYPLLVSFALLTLTISGVMTFHGYNNGTFLLWVGFLSTILSMGLWFKDVTREGTLCLFLINLTIFWNIYSLVIASVLIILQEGLSESNIIMNLRDFTLIRNN